MAERRVPCPSVFVVDTQMCSPPLPPKPGQFHYGGGTLQRVLLVLVVLALGGMTMEACFIYHLYMREPRATEGQVERYQDDKANYIMETTTERTNHFMKPPKPMAHLTVFQLPGKGDLILWDLKAQPVISEIQYKDGELIMQKEGYYFVYSKISFIEQETSTFKHAVYWKTPRYLGGSMLLLQSRSLQPAHGKKPSMSNSYLGGLFYLNQEDSIFVNVSSHTAILRSSSAENFFGVYMV